jgi:DNA-binding NarL/FixJ family response regulator
MRLDFDDLQLDPLQKQGLLENSNIRVVIVDDFEPFRGFVRALLRKMPQLAVICELSDGLTAVQKAEELNPDLILLDIGLPTLNGIEAARQIRKLVPTAKIIFLSQESSDDVVQEALSLGALGYVVKEFAGSELLPAVKVALEGKQFVSGGVTGKDSAAPDRTHPSDVRPSHAPFDSQETEIIRRHEVFFYLDDASFLARFSGFIKAALESENAVVVVATESHLVSLRQALQAQGVDVAAVVNEGRYIPLNVVETLATFMVDGLPDRVRFQRVASDLIRTATRAVNGKHRGVSACGECAPTLLGERSVAAAIQVEQLWDEVARTYGVDILCGYSSGSFDGDKDSHIFQKVRAEHSGVYQE